jgi:hypothetical protein
VGTIVWAIAPPPLPIEKRDDVWSGRGVGVEDGLPKGAGSGIVW